MNNYDLDNPFSVTKATEFTDIQINEYWVDYNFEEKQSILSILNPTEYLPKYVLGGKGCGKTHVLRYFSYNIQKIRKSKDISRILNEDKYIGIYSVLDGLNSSRFEKKGINIDEWKSVFEYYFELYNCDKLLTIIKDIFNDLNFSISEEKSFVDNIIKLFYVNENQESINNIASLANYLTTLRRKIDLEIVNAPFNRKLEYSSVKILFSPGDLLFGIPTILVKQFQIFENVKFIYILDEYEKLFEWQKIFINTLVWDKKIPCTFWIGARKHGYTTRLTKSGEELKPGSEFQPIHLDSVIRKNNELYKLFAKELYLNRLKKHFLQKGLNFNSETIEKTLSIKFEKYTDEKIIDELKKKKELKHIKDLNEKLQMGIKKGVTYGVVDESKIPNLINELLENTQENPLEQKYKIFLFYKKWANAKIEIDTIPNIIEFVNLEYNKSMIGVSSEFDNIKEKYKNDFLAQLTSENNIKNVCYSGIDDFIDISWGNPRVFLLILKVIIEKSKFKGEKPLEEGSNISLDSQFQGVYETAKWFYDDAEVIGDTGKNLYKSISNLADLFRLYRFADKPTETSVSCFNFNLEELSDTALDYIRLAEVHSLIVEIESGRKEKNSGRIEKLYQLNKTLAPLWNLPSVRRGTASLNSAMAEAIFNPSKHKEFDTLYKEFKRNRTAPSFCKSKTIKKIKTQDQQSLFNDNM